MNAPLDMYEPPFIPRDLELETLALGVAMLGYPLPDELEAAHFTGLNRLIFQAARELGGKATLPTVAALLRDQGNLYTREHGPDRHSKPGMLSSVDLVAMVEAADFSLRMGWPVEFERLVEMGRRRRLVECMQRALIKLRHDAVDVDDVRKGLEEVF